MDERRIQRIFDLQSEDGCWKTLTPKDKYYPDYMHYVPTFKATLWVLIQLAEMGCPPCENRIEKPFKIIKDHFFDPALGIYLLKESSHIPLPCLNGNMIYLDAYFHGTLSGESRSAINFFIQNQRFDDGKYETPKNSFCSNKSCYGKHSCYWGVVKLLKGISFIPVSERNESIEALKRQCIDFILLHRVCYRSSDPEKLMIQKIDHLTFPHMYKGDFLEILWLLKREKIQSQALTPALNLLKSKETPDGSWLLERSVNNLISSIGAKGKANPYITRRAREVLDFYG